VQGQEAPRTADARTVAGLSSRRVSSTGGFLQQGKTTLHL